MDDGDNGGDNDFVNNDENDANTYSISISQTQKLIASTRNKNGDYQKNLLCAKPSKTWICSMTPSFYLVIRTCHYSYNFPTHYNHNFAKTLQNTCYWFLWNLLLIGLLQMWVQFKKYHFQIHFTSLAEVNTTEPNQWQVYFDSGDGLVPSAYKPLPEPMLTMTSNAICHH